MPKIQIDSIDYEVDELTEDAKRLLGQIQNITVRVQEIQNMSAILTKAKRAYIADLKNEMLSAKAGLFFDNE